MHAPAPTATYRFQLTPTFGFDQVAAQLGRLQALGVSHVYLSPITEATPGSSHGYDVVDHTTVRDELGGLERLAALLDACAQRNMGVLVDHVPNHVSVGRPELNRPWWAMLRDGQASAAAAWFDVEWTAAAGKVILPVLGEPLEAVVDRFERTGDELHLGSQRWPLAPGTEHLPIDELLARQHYRLQFWRDPARNVRRFFTIDDLVAVRVDDRAVAAVVDTVPRLLTGHEAFAGVRVDHVDGLADPRGYLKGCARSSAIAGSSSRRSSPPARWCPRTGPSRAPPGTSTPPSSSTPCSTRPDGAACTSGGPTSSVTPARSGSGSCRPAGRCSTGDCARTWSASPGSPAAWSRARPTSSRRPSPS